MNWLKDNWFKLLAIAILLGALGTHAYAYYQILRWVVCLASAYTAYLYYQSKHTPLSLLFVAMAVLFNPIAPIYMSRDTWQIFDLLGAVVFLIFLYPIKSRAK